MTKPDKITSALALAALVCSVGSAMFVSYMAPAPQSMPPVAERVAPIPEEAEPAPRLRVTLPDGSRRIVSSAPIDVQAASCRIAVSRKVRCTQAGCEYEISWGTGTYIAHDRVLTCSHLFDDGGDSLEVFFAGQPHQAKLLKRDRKADLALLEVETPFVSVAIPNTNPVQYQQQPVQPTGYVDVLHEAEPITICGYGGDGVLQTQVGRFKRWAKYVDGRKSFFMDTKNRSGDSGGGAFNPAGQLIGVQWGCPESPDPDGAAITSGEPMVKFLWGQD